MLAYLFTLIPNVTLCSKLFKTTKYQVIWNRIAGQQFIQHEIHFQSSARLQFGIQKYKQISGCLHYAHKE